MLLPRYGSSVHQLLNGGLLLCQKYRNFAGPSKNLEVAIFLLVVEKVLFLRC